jgi:hypothetical protein
MLVETGVQHQAKSWAQQSTTRQPKVQRSAVLNPTEADWAAAAASS